MQAVGPALLGCWGEQDSPQCSLGTVQVCVCCPHSPAPASLSRTQELPTGHCEGSGDGGSRRGSSALSPLPQEPESALKCPKIPSRRFQHWAAGSWCQ